jgi:hypothetical protein
LEIFTELSAGAREVSHLRHSNHASSVMMYGQLGRIPNPVHHDLTILLLVFAAMAPKYCSFQLFLGKGVYD